MKKKILYIVNVDKFFLSHRLKIALRAKSFLNINLATKFELEENFLERRKSQHTKYILKEEVSVYFPILLQW